MGRARVQISTPLQPMAGGLPGPGSDVPEPVSGQRIQEQLLPGRMVGDKYQLIAPVGEGAIGRVMAAVHLVLGEKVAIKFLRRELLGQPESAREFAYQANAAFRIRSSHVARVFDLGALPDGTPYMVMEYLEGQDLLALLREQGRQPAPRAVRFILQACEALAEAHALGIVHGDIKPKNLFLARDLRGFSALKVLDFAITARAPTRSVVDARSSAPTELLTPRSPLYLSPEQIRGGQGIDARADIWSLGCVLYELLSGRPAFDAGSWSELSARVLEDDPEPLYAHGPDIHPGLEACIGRSLRKDPRWRFQNIAEFAMALFPFGEESAWISAERCCRLLGVAGTSDFANESAGQTEPTAPARSMGAHRSSIPTTLLPASTGTGAWRKLVLVGLVLTVALAVACVLRGGSPPNNDPRIATSRFRTLLAQNAPSPARSASAGPAQASPLPAEPIRVTAASVARDGAGPPAASRLPPPTVKATPFFPRRPLRAAVPRQARGAEPDPGF